MRRSFWKHSHLAFPTWIWLEPTLDFLVRFGSGHLWEDGMFVKLTDGTITRWINMDAVIQMRFR